MARLCAATALSVILAGYFQQVGIPQILQDARTLLTRAEASSGGSAERQRALNDAADRFERLAGHALPPDILKELQEAATTLRREARETLSRMVFQAAPL